MNEQTTQPCPFFSPEIRVENELYGGGYRIRIHSPWHPAAPDIQGFRIQLAGKNPLTGRDLEELNIGCLFTFDNQEYHSKVLSFHGNFSLKKYVRFANGSEEYIGSEPVSLVYKPNEPYVRFTCSPSANKYGHKWIALESNCWKSCDGKIWLAYDGRTQRLPAVNASSGTFKWYLPTQGDIEIQITDDTIRLEKER